MKYYRSFGRSNGCSFLYVRLIVGGFLVAHFSCSRRFVAAFVLSLLCLAGWLAVRTVACFWLPGFDLIVLCVCVCMCLFMDVYVLRVPSKDPNPLKRTVN